MKTNKNEMSDEEFLNELNDDEYSNQESDDDEVDTKLEEQKKRTARMKQKNRKISFNSLDIGKNPYYSESKLNLDDEYDNGFRQIETNLLLELLKKDMTATEMKVFFYILHRTRGFCNDRNKCCYWHRYISTKEIIEAINGKKSTVDRALKSLSDKHIIYSIKNEAYDRKLTSINYRFDTWQ